MMSELDLLEILTENRRWWQCSDVYFRTQLEETFSFCKEANPRGSDNDLKGAKIAYFEIKCIAAIV